MKNSSTMFNHLQKVMAFSALAFFSHASTANLVQNGEFNASAAGQLNSSSYSAGVTVPDWTNNGGYTFVLDAASAASGVANNFGNTTALHGSINGASGYFIAADGDPTYSRSIQQEITGLTVGQNYILSFDWAAGQQLGYGGDSTSQWNVSLGNSAFTTPTVTNPSESFTGWFNQSFEYTATSSTATLSFLAAGAPSGVPPFALLDNVSVSAVPVPMAFPLLLSGLVGLGFMRKKNKAA